MARYENMIPRRLKSQSQSMLKRKVFFVFRSGLKMFCSVYCQSQVHSKCFCLTARLGNIIPWILLVTTIYTCCTKPYTSVKIFSVSWLGLKTFCSLYYQAKQFESLVYKHDFVGIIRSQQLFTLSEKYLFLISGCRCTYCFIHCTLFIFLISILTVLYNWLYYIVEKKLSSKIFFSMY